MDSIWLAGGALATSQVDVAKAHSASCATGFNMYSSLAALPNKASDTFCLSPFYQQTCGSYGTFTVDDNPSGPQYGHYHLSYENSCISCFVNGTFGLDRGARSLSGANYVMDYVSFRAANTSNFSWDNFKANM